MATASDILLLLPPLLLSLGGGGLSLGLLHLAAGFSYSSCQTRSKMVHWTTKVARSSALPANTSADDVLDAEPLEGQKSMEPVLRYWRCAGRSGGSAIFLTFFAGELRVESVLAFWNSREP